MPDYHYTESLRTTFIYIPLRHEDGGIAWVRFDRIESVHEVGSDLSIIVTESGASMKVQHSADEVFDIIRKNQS